MLKFFRKIRFDLMEKPQKDKASRYFKYAIGEIVLVVIGILIALSINNWNEARIEQNRIKKYAKSLIQDLENDIDMLNISLFQVEEAYEAIDSLKSYMRTTEYEDVSNTFLYLVVHDIIYRPYFWNRSTFDELKSSGSLRLIKNDSLEKKLVAYEAFSIHLDEDFSFDKINAEKADQDMVAVLNLNSNYLDKIKEWEIANFNSFFKAKINTKVYRESIANDIPLISYDPEKLHQLVNNCILIQNNYEVRAFKEMHQIIRDAQVIIALLKQEYNFQDD